MLFSRKKFWGHANGPLLQGINRHVRNHNICAVTEKDPKMPCNNNIERNASKFILVAAKGRAMG